MIIRGQHVAGFLVLVISSAFYYMSFEQLHWFGL